MKRLSHAAGIGLLIFLMLSTCQASSWPMPAQNSKHKSLEFYMRLNASGSPGRGMNSGSLGGIRFGTVLPLYSLLTEDFSANSAPLGVAIGTYYAAHGYNGPYHYNSANGNGNGNGYNGGTGGNDDNFTAFFSFTTLLTGKFKGSLSFAGAENMLDGRCDVAVVGGTGDFMLARGIATISNTNNNNDDANDDNTSTNGYSNGNGNGNGNGNRNGNGNGVILHVKVMLYQK